MEISPCSGEGLRLSFAIMSQPYEAQPKSSGRTTKIVLGTLLVIALLLLGWKLIANGSGKAQQASLLDASGKPIAALNGKDGKDGANGKDGAAGPIGLSGIDGSNGAAGATGPAGA